MPDAATDGEGMPTEREWLEGLPEDDAASEHYYRVHVQGYVVVKGDEDMNDAQLNGPVLEAVEAGEVEVKHFTVDEEWSE